MDPLAAWSKLCRCAPLVGCNRCPTVDLSVLLPSSLQGAVEYLQQRHGVDLAAAMHSCVSEQNKLIAFRGGGLTWCPEAPE